VAVLALAPGTNGQEASAVLPYLDSAIENGSPLWWDVVDRRTVLVHLLYDHERGAPNRAAGHVHFVFHAPSGSTWTIVLTNLHNVWNGRPGSVGRDIKVLSWSPDGRFWTPAFTTTTDTNDVRLEITMPGDTIHIARIEPYRLSDLDRLLESLRGCAGVEFEVIGRTVEGRPLEMIRIGPPEAQHHFVVRARAHPWESGGNWVVEGLVRRLVFGSAEDRRLLRRACVHVLPMANKDGVARGRTRFNVAGWDLNRRWDAPADPALAPENDALERWLRRQIAAGRRPILAVDLHNDGGGRLHVSHPEGAPESYFRRMELLEDLLRRHTWFDEGSTGSSFRNPGTLGEGWLLRFGVPAVILELNTNRAGRLDRPPTGQDWQEFGAALADVFEAYARLHEAPAEPVTR